MDYNLAKQLKDTGFPQMDGRYLNNGEVYVPTLEELIEACGDGFQTLERYKGVPDRWQANTLKQKSFLGATPVEAVAKLWLALNPKKTI